MPYAIFQRNVGWTELRNGDLRIDQELVVPRSRSVRRIVEKRLPGIAVASRKALREALGRNVRLHLTYAVEGQNDRIIAGEFLVK